MYDIFKDIIIDTDGMIQGLVAFIISFAIFSFVMIRAWRTRRDDDGHMANLPLSNDTETSHTTKS